MRRLRRVPAWTQRKHWLRGSALAAPGCFHPDPRWIDCLRPHEHPLVCFLLGLDAERHVEDAAVDEDVLVQGHGHHVVRSQVVELPRAQTRQVRPQALRLRDGDTEGLGGLVFWKKPPMPTLRELLRLPVADEVQEGVRCDSCVAEVMRQVQVVIAVFRRPDTQQLRLHVAPGDIAHREGRDPRRDVNQLAPALALLVRILHSRGRSFGFMSARWAWLPGASRTSRHRFGACP
mmetsp:Transcript_75702/g.225687  ORF Transcript_75702/g.225687 Transcript_75702/m.225687 type:complete len:233 (-) Transcript_75702:117-815(-)